IAGGKKNEFAVLLHVQLPALERETVNLEELLKGAGQDGAASSLADLKESLESSRQKIQNDLAFVDTRAAQARADADFATAKRVLNAFLYELNIYSVAPVAIFDIARVWPTATAARYAVGGGLRLSLVNVNFTLGYAASPVRRT